MVLSSLDIHGLTVSRLTSVILGPITSDWTAQQQSAGQVVEEHWPEFQWGLPIGECLYSSVFFSVNQNLLVKSFSGFKSFTIFGNREFRIYLLNEWFCPVGQSFLSIIYMYQADIGRRFNCQKLGFSKVLCSEIAQLDIC